MVSDTKEYNISVVIPAYNAGKYIARAIDSVLAQSRAADEIIVVDDGSTDNTAEIVAQYRSRVMYIHQDNAGASVARNAGIEAATGQWIAFLDADDEWLPEKLAIQLELLERNPDLMWVTGNYILCACRTSRQRVHIAPEKAASLTDGKDFFISYFEAFVQDAWGCTDTMLVRRDVFEEIGVFEVGKNRNEDMDMWFRIAYRSPQVGYVSNPIAVYHLDVPGSLIRDRSTMAVGAYCDFLERNLELSREHGRLADFRPCAIYLLRRWLRAMLFEARGRDVRAMIRQFGVLLPGWYKAFMWLLTAFPKTTAAGCRMISRIVRLLGLRKRLVRSR